MRVRRHRIWIAFLGSRNKWQKRRNRAFASFPSTTGGGVRFQRRKIYNLGQGKCTHAHIKFHIGRCISSLSCSRVHSQLSWIEHERKRCLIGTAFQVLLKKNDGSVTLLHPYFFLISLQSTPTDSTPFHFRLCWGSSYLFVMHTYDLVAGNSRGTISHLHSVYAYVPQRKKSSL